VKPALTADADLEWVFDHAVEELQHRFGYSADAAEALTRDYYQRFRDPEYCKSIHLRAQNDEHFFHEGPGGMALLIHYYLGIKGDPARDRFIDWRTQYFKDLRSAGQKKS
jgi:hypothetical protein